MTGSARLAASSAIAGALVGIAITPFMAAAWAYKPGVVWDNLPMLERTVGPTLESWGALTFGAGREFAADGRVVAESTPYEVYGKAFFLVYLLMLPVVHHTHELRSRQRPSPWESRTWRAMWVALIVAGLGDAVSYWGVSLLEPLGTLLWRVGFLAEVLAVLVVLLATTGYGVVAMRRRYLPVWAAGLLAAIVPIVAVTLWGVSSYVPNAVVVPLSLIWAAIGIWLVTSSPARPRTLNT